MTRTQMNAVLFGAAYYDEYMPYDRLEQDVSMLKAAHMNTVRIAESTWATMEPWPGEFDFSHIDRVIDAMEAAGINVIVGTPTYAAPDWLVHMHPDILVRQHDGPRRYGPRQIMDIASQDFREAAERAIRALVAHVADRPAVIGYQLDNETKYYDVLNDDVQQAFVQDLRVRFHDDLDAINRTFGLNYWSNRITDWNTFPDLTETINASLAGAFDRFRRTLVTQYLSWQASIVREYARNDQFITQNHDMEWRGHSYGVQPWADHFANAGILDVTGVDLYHPAQSHLTGKEIAFGGDLSRCTKPGHSHLVLETQAQGQPGWLPYPGQLRLQAYDHLASGANAIMYWPWHSIHNSFETYWKGVLSHDCAPNPIYREAGILGAELECIGAKLLDLRKRNRVALIVSNDSLSALNRFNLETGFPKPHPYEEGDSSGLAAYNDVVRWIYDALYDLNIETDILPGDHVAGDVSIGRESDAEAAITADALAAYDLIITPALYCTSQTLIDLLRDYVHHGGHLLSTFRSFTADRDVTVHHDRQPHGLADVFGIRVGESTRPDGQSRVWLTHTATGADESDSSTARVIMELIEPDDGTTTIARYEHPVWNRYAAATRRTHGEGWAQWIGTMTSPELIRTILLDAALAAGIGWDEDADDGLAGAMALAGRITVRRGVNRDGRRIIYLLNHTPHPVTFDSPFAGDDLLALPERDSRIRVGSPTTIEPWGVMILES